MSIKDPDLVARSFAMISQSGLDRGFKCTNDPTTYTLALTQRQTRPTKMGGLVSILIQGTATWTEPVTGEVMQATANITLKVKNSASQNLAQAGAQHAVLAVLRQVLPAEDATSNTAAKAVVNSMLLGVLPTP